MAPSLKHDVLFSEERASLSNILAPVSNPISMSTLMYWAFSGKVRFRENQATLHPKLENRLPPVATFILSQNCKHSFHRIKSLATTKKDNHDVP